MEQEQIKIKFEDLQKRAQKINEAGIKLNTQIAHAQQVLSKIKENALKLYKTDNLGELKRLEEQQTKENLDTIAQFEADILAKEKEINEKIELIKQINT